MRVGLASSSSSSFSTQGSRVALSGGRARVDCGVELSGDGVVVPDGVADVRAWYDPLLSTDPDGVSPLVNGSSVGSYPDVVGIGPTLTAAGAARPTYQGAGINGAPALRFTAASSQKLSAALGGGVTPFDSPSGEVILVVCKPVTITTDDATSYANQALIADADNGYTGIYLRTTGPKAVGYLWDGGDQHADVTIPAANTDAFLLSLVFSEWTLSIQKNNEAPVVHVGAVGSRTSITSPLQLGHGAGGYFDGYLGPVIVLSRFDATNFARLKEYLRRRYSLWV